MWHLHWHGRRGGSLIYATQTTRFNCKPTETMCLVDSVWRALFVCDIGQTPCCFLLSDRIAMPGDEGNAAETIESSPYVAKRYVWM